MAFIIENIHSPIAGDGHSLVVTRDIATRRVVLAKNRHAGNPPRRRADARASEGAAYRSTDSGLPV